MSTPLESTHARPRKRRPVALWATVIWTALMLIWLIVGVGGTDCAGDTACETGGGIAVVLGLGVWAFGLFVIMAITVIVRLANRD